MFACNPIIVQDNNWKGQRLWKITESSDALCICIYADDLHRSIRKKGSVKDNHRKSWKEEKLYEEVQNREIKKEMWSHRSVGVSSLWHLSRKLSDTPSKGENRGMFSSFFIHFSFDLQRWFLKELFPSFILLGILFLSVTSFAFLLCFPPLLVSLHLFQQLAD